MGENHKRSINKKQIANLDRPIKIFVFDLDGTLWNQTKLYPDVIDILQYHKDKGHFITLASYNIYANEILRRLKIDHYFHGGAMGSSITKSNHILEILNFLKKRYKKCNISSTYSITFFDDDPANITEVNNKSKGFVDAVLIDPKIGLNWKSLKKCDRKIRFGSNQIREIEARE